MAPIRSLLFVPGDSERKIAKAMESVADALILDLEDAVSPDRKPHARALCRDALGADRRGKRVFVRINALDSGEAAADLAATMAGQPFGIMLPKCASARDLARLDDMLTVLEARDGIATGATVVLPIVTETGSSMLGFGSYARARPPRLFGLTWGAEDLAADLGARTNRDDSGAYAFPFQMARALCLYAAAATGTAAIDSVFTDFRDPAGLAAEARTAARSGFAGKMAIHPDQAEVINQGFMPSPDDVSHARQVMDAFAAAGDTGVASLAGRMLDRPHRRAAARVLDLVRADSPGTLGG